MLMRMLADLSIIGVAIDFTSIFVDFAGGETVFSLDS